MESQELITEILHRRGETLDCARDQRTLRSSVDRDRGGDAVTLIARIEISELIPIQGGIGKAEFVFEYSRTQIV